MKMLALSLMVLILSSAAYAATPTAEDFNKVAAQSRQLGYRGYDVTICYSGEAVVVAGVSFWNAALQIYLVDANGNITPTKVLTLDPVVDQLKYSVNGEQIELNFAAEMTSRDGLVVRDAKLVRGSTEAAQNLKCFQQNSGLE